MHFEIGDLEAMAFERKAHLEAGIADWTEKFGGLYMYHSVHIPKAWMNYILKVLVNCQLQQEQSKEFAGETFHFLQMHPQEGHEKQLQPIVYEESPTSIRINN